MKISKGDVSQYVRELKLAKEQQLKQKYGMNHEVIKNVVMSYLEKDIEKLEEVREVVLKMSDSDVLSTYLSGMTGSYLQSLIYDFNGLGSARKIIEANIMKNLTNFNQLGSKDDKENVFTGLQNEALLDYIITVWDPIRLAYDKEIKESQETIQQINRVVARAKDGYDAIKSLKSMGLDTERAIQIFQERKALAKAPKNEIIKVPENIKAFEGLPKLK